MSFCAFRKNAFIGRFCKLFTSTSFNLTEMNTIISNYFLHMRSHSLNFLNYAIYLNFMQIYKNYNENISSIYD